MDNLRFINDDAKATFERWAHAGESLTRGGNGGGGMEGRIARLESQYDKIDERLRGVEISQGELKTTISHLPGKGFIVTALTLGIGALTTVLAFMDKIQAFLHK